jgi:hypothetical protein
MQVNVGASPIDINFCLSSSVSSQPARFGGEGSVMSQQSDSMNFAKLEHYTCMVDLLGRAGHP